MSLLKNLFFPSTRKFQQRKSLYFFRCQSVKQPVFDLPDSLDDVVQTDHLIIGGGVVGLAIANKLVRAKKRSSYLDNTDRTILVERNSMVGEETSARNSAVIHAGIYYPENSFKETFCIEGRRQLYKYCNREGIPYSKIGKWIVAQDQIEQMDYLHKLHSKGDKLGVPLRFVSQKEAASLEPQVKGELILESSETGILDVAAYVQSLEYKYLNSGDSQHLATGSTVTHIYDSPFHAKTCFLVRVDCDAGPYWIETRNLINAAGLGAASIANRIIEILSERNPKANIVSPSFEYNYCKGNYFRYSGSSLANRLVYPVPDSKLTSLGLHLTLDLAGQARFGPDVEFLEPNSSLDSTLNSGTNLNYGVNEERLSLFTKAIQAYLPSVDPSRLQPDYSGIRPRLSTGVSDFILRNETDDSSAGCHVFNLVGIESPGLTSSLAIGDWVASQIYTVQTGSTF